VNTPARLIAVEGIDGCGKSTQALRIGKKIDALVTREPGGTKLGQQLRELLLSPDHDPISLRSEVLLMIADRAEHVESVIRPALLRGQHVVTDRYAGSTFAYQGSGRGVDFDALKMLNHWGSDGVTPDLSILFDLPVSVAIARRKDAKTDRVESMDVSFHERVRHGFLTLAHNDPQHWAIVDASQSLEAVSKDVDDILAERLGLSL
jgi:dTMP kinase